MTIIYYVPPSIHLATWLAISSTFLLYSSLCQAGLINLTIDDSFGDQISGFKPWHNPPGLPWVNQACSDCAIQPDPSRAFNGTWMASTSSPALKGVSITLEFKGVAIWVFFILANANPKATVTNTSCTFNLDGSNAGHFVHTPDTSTSDLIYNATVFSATNLSNVNHTLDILINDGAPSYTNFDYAIYTAVQGDTVTPGGASPSTSSASTLIDSSLTSFGSTTSNLMSPTLVPTLDSSNQPNNIRPSRMVGPIVGAVLGSLAIIVFLFLFLRSRYPKYQAMHRPPTNSLLDVASSQLPVQDTSCSRSLERGTTGQDPVTPTTSTARVPLQLSDGRARLGLKAAAWARLYQAQARQILSPSRRCGPGQAWARLGLKPRLRWFEVHETNQCHLFVVSVTRRHHTQRVGDFESLMAANVYEC